MYLSAMAIAATAALAWPIVRSDRVHRAFAIWASAMAILELVRALAPESAPVAVAAGSVGSLGLLGVCLWAFDGRRLAWMPWLAAVAAFGVAHPAIDAATREGVSRALWAVATAATWVWIARALRRGGEPRLRHLAVMIFAGAAVARIGIPASSAASGVPMAAAGVGALAAHAWWLARVGRASEAREEATGDASVVGDGDVHVRGDERMGDLVDVADAIRRRREREERARGGIGEA